jgi:preprotein translocase subunit SecG
MILAIIIFVILLTILLTLLVLAQNPKSGGGGSPFGGSSGGQLMGVQKQGDLLEKLTWGFAIGIMVLSIGANLMIKERNLGGLQDMENEQVKAAEEGAVIENIQPVPTENSDETAE